jgi:hypothetical protein
MTKFYIRTIRYALSVIATIGFGVPYNYRYAYALATVANVGFGKSYQKGGHLK